jgi:hypothetical protein
VKPNDESADFITLNSDLNFLINYTVKIAKMQKKIIE